MITVKKLKWDENLTAVTEFGFRYTVYQEFSRDVDCWAVNTLDGVFLTIEAAKAAAQSAYEARILSALEPFANSYPQGANLAAHSKNENGPDHEPSPRAQALEFPTERVNMPEPDSDARIIGFRIREGDKQWGRSGLYEAMQWLNEVQAAALSSQPVADGWLPIETAPKDGSEFLAYQGGRYFNCWCIAGCWTDDAESDPFPTHWRPLPSVPGNSERCRDCDGYNCDDGCAYPDRTRVQTLEEVISELKEAERKIFSWSGSSFVANELEGAEDADCKSELYSDLCKLGNVMSWLQTQVSALSQPAADHIADAGKMVADGWLPIENEPDNEQGPFLVTNNPSALNAFGRPSHVWCVSGIYKEKDGSFCAFEGNQKIHGLLMFMPVTAPLPASPGASE